MTSVKWEDGLALSEVEGSQKLENESTREPREPIPPKVQLVAVWTVASKASSGTGGGGARAGASASEVVSSHSE